MIVNLYGKVQHGLRVRDLDHRDKQNFDAVKHIIKACHLLENIPDAVGTTSYISVMKSAIDSYLDKSLSPEKRIEEIWYATFFLRYWRQWVITNPKFTLKNNFITNNAYMCVEINAHSLLAFIFFSRGHIQANDENIFLPWMLGSQSCESFSVLTQHDRDIFDDCKFQYIGHAAKIT